MKKLSALLLCFVLILTLAACSGGQSDDAKSKPGTSSGIESDPVESNEATDSSEDDASLDISGSMTMDEFVELANQSMGSMLESLEGTGMSMKIYARGNSLVYSYQYSIDFPDTGVDIDEMFEGAMEPMEETFTTALESMKLAVPTAQSLIVEYLDKEGNILYTKEFK